MSCILKIESAVVKYHIVAGVKAEVKRAIASLDYPPCWLDGEIAGFNDIVTNGHVCGGRGDIAQRYALGTREQDQDANRERTSRG